MKRKNKKLIIALLLLVIVGMGVGYSILSKQLKIEGTASIATNFDVAITNIEKLDNDSVSKYYNPTLGIYQNYQYSTDENYYNTTVENKQPEFTSTTATFDVTFNHPNDSITYVVEMKNNSNVGAKLDEIVVGETQSAISVTPLLDYSNQNIRISPNETLKYFVTVSYPQYNDLIGGMSSKVDVTFTFSEYTGASYGGPEEIALLTFDDKITSEGIIKLVKTATSSAVDDADLFVSIDGLDYTIDEEGTESLEFRIPEFLNDGELHSIKLKLANSYDTRATNEIELKYQK